MAKKRNPYQNDHHTRAARAAGFPARSVYKLEEIQKRVRLLGAGKRVLDLGAAPGSWSKYAGQQVGPKGLVVAIDLSAIEEQLGANVHIAQGDALDPDSALIAEHAPYDVVLSDMAPRTSGDKVRDRYLSYELAVGALEVAKRVGKPGSDFVAKIFMSEDFDAAKKAVQAAYESCKIVRPAATRDASTEVFLVGVRLKAQAMTSQQAPPSSDAPRDGGGVAQ
ncbi:MAG: RlmE family RNA methyltransferase [Polyangiaceae bacterium]|nr:RlmE family RNA methyltransferase [Myxococcales bacterium]MCB9584434.1 RlmE family RNA methyltransferase [Polyangiaceae bacterium]